MESVYATSEKPHTTALQTEIQDPILTQVLSTFCHLLSLSPFKGIAGILKEQNALSKI